MSSVRDTTATQTASTSVEHHRADTRFHTRFSWLDSRHSFSFGGHFDPANVGHGLLIVSNDDRVAPGGGFGTHPHRDMEIVTWVLEGELEHADSAGHEGIIRPGLAQRMSAGSGIMHSEQNHSATEAVHFVQMWVPPHETGIEPGYEQLDVNDRLDAGGLVPVASGRGHDGAVHIHQRGAVMWVGRLGAGESVDLPDAAFVHVFVPRGAGSVGDTDVYEGDALRLSSAGSLAFTATAATEVIVWESDAEMTR